MKIEIRHIFQEVQHFKGDKIGDVLSKRINEILIRLFKNNHRQYRKKYKSLSCNEITKKSVIMSTLYE